MAGATTSSNTNTTSLTDLNPVAAITGFFKNDLFSATSSGIKKTDLKIPLPNPLHNYATYNYIISLYCLSADSYNFPDKTYMNGKLPPLICKSANADPNNRIQLLDGGKYDFYIEDLTINGSVGFSPDAGNTTGTQIEFTVIEPYSMGMFVEVLQIAAAQHNYAMWSEAPYLLVIEFKGNTDTGQLTSIPNTKKYMPIKFTKCDLKVDEHGSSWRVAGYATSGEALNDVYTKLKNEVSLVGKTVQELLQSGPNSLQNAINARYKKAVELGTAKVADEILILFPVDISTNADAPQVSAPGSTENNSSATDNNTKMSAEEIYKKLGVTRGSTSASLTQLSNTCNVIGKSRIDINVSGTTPFKADDLVWNEKTKSVDRSKVSQGNDGSTFNFAQDSSILTAINQVILKSEFAIDTLLEQNLTPEGMIKQWKIEPKVYYLNSTANNAITGTLPKLIVYSIILYEAHSSNSLPPNASAHGLTELKKQVVKEYNYIYTGKNIDLLKFEFQMNNTFYNTQYVDLSKFSSDIITEKNTGISNEAKQPESSRNVPQGDPNTKPGWATAITRYIETYSSLDYKGGSRGDTVGSRAAKLFHDAIIKSYDLQTITIEIIGDPYYISTSGLGNYTDTQLEKKNITKDGSANYQNGEVHIIINFRTPTDINQATGLYNLKNSNLCQQFSGLFKLLSIQHMFKDGKFIQSITANRIQGQDNNAEPTSSSLFYTGQTAKISSGFIPDLPMSVQQPGFVKSALSQITPNLPSITGGG